MIGHVLQTAGRIFRRATLLGTRHKVVIVSLRGISAKFEISSPIERFRTVEFGGEREFLTDFLSGLRDGDVILDVGASIGLVTVFAGMVNESVKIAAFEPDPETLSRLQHNVSLNGLSERVTTSGCALGAEPGTAVLFTNGLAGYAPTLRTQPERKGAPTGEASVRVGTVDLEVADGRIPLPSLVKIDVEGAEVMVLKGATRLLSGDLGPRPRLVFLELHPQFLPSFDATETDAHECMAQTGYRLLSRSERYAQVHEVYSA